MSFVARITIPVEGPTFCLVDVALFMSLLDGSWMTAVPEPDENEIAEIGAVFS